MLSNIQQADRQFDRRASLMIGLAALGAMLAPVGAGAQQQTQQTQQQQQQQTQRPAVPLNQRPLVNQARPGINGTNNNVPATQNNATQNLRNGVQNLFNKNGNQNAGVQNNGVQNLFNKGGTQNAAGQNNGVQNLFNKGGTQNAAGQNNGVQNLFNKGGTQNAAGQNNGVQNMFNKGGTQNAVAQKASLPITGTQPGSTRSLPSPAHVPPAIANQQTGRAVPSRTFAGHPGPAGSTETTSRNGNIVRKAADGSVIDVRNPKNGMLIHHSLNGDRRVVVERPDHTRIVTASRGVQYVQHPYNFGGHTYINRTFYVHGKVTNQLYRPYNYGGTSYDVYATGRYYDPRFYQWATSRQSAPQSFNWSYTSGNAPWYAYYKGVFTPETSYTSPALWMADYVIASSLKSHYENNAPAASDAPPADPSAAITPQVKQGVADEITRQIKIESNEAQQTAQHKEPDPAAASVITEISSDRATHDFIADSQLDLIDPSGRRCILSEGDVVEVSGAPAPGSSSVTAVVMFSKGDLECGRSAQVEVALTDLQEMQNHMRETADQAMADTKAAKEVPSSKPEFAAAAPPADADAPHELDEQNQQLVTLEDG
jgi:hypothetical protein